jgi:hypothetical protein
VAAGVIYALKLEDNRPRSNSVRLPPRATPAQEPPTLQQRRATERGRGRRAHVPQRIPWRGWKDILVRTYREILDDRLLALAAGVTFYSLIALFPAIAAGVSSYALFADVATIGKHLAVAATIRLVVNVRDIQQEADMTMRIPEEISSWLSGWSLVAMGLDMVPPRDPDDDDEEEEEENDDEEEVLAVIREPDE